MRTWQSYKCTGLNYRMLVIESLDADTETRRLSPVAVLGDGFVDLINGRRFSLKTGNNEVIGSSMCLIVLRSSGSRVVCRLHMPKESVSLPQHRSHQPFI